MYQLLTVLFQTFPDLADISDCKSGQFTNVIYMSNLLLDVYQQRDHYTVLSYIFLYITILSYIICLFSFDTTDMHNLRDVVMELKESIESIKEFCSSLRVKNENVKVEKPKREDKVVPQLVPPSPDASREASLPSSSSDTETDNVSICFEKFNRHLLTYSTQRYSYFLLAMP